MLRWLERFVNRMNVVPSIGTGVGAMVGTEVWKGKRHLMTSSVSWKRAVIDRAYLVQTRYCLCRGKAASYGGHQGRESIEKLRDCNRSLELCNSTKGDTTPKDSICGTGTRASNR